MSSELGRTPMWVMKNFTHPQLMLFYSKIKSADFEFVKLQARMVWAIANGWKEPKKVSSENIDSLKSTVGGMFKEE